MNYSVFIAVTVSVILLLCLAIVIYFQIYKRNINKALSNGGKPKHLIEPYKIVFVLIVMLVSVSIAVTSAAGLLNSNRYFQSERNFAQSISARTVYLNCSFAGEKIRRANAEDIDSISDILTQKYPARKFNVIAVYNCHGVMIDGHSVNLFAVDEKYCSFLGLDEMRDGAIYSDFDVSEKIELEICVTKTVGNGYESDRLERLTLNAENKIAENSLAAAVCEQELMPSASEGTAYFVNMNTFYDIASILLDKRIDNSDSLSKYEGLAGVCGIYICTESLSMVSPVSTALTSQGYNAYAIDDTFDNFEKAVRVSFIAFILSSVGLICLSAVNVYLTVKAVGKVGKSKG